MTGRRCWFGVVAVLALLVCAAGGWFAAAGEREAGLRRLPVDSALLSADGRTVTAARSGQCLGTTLLHAAETASTVTLGMTVVPHTSGCVGGVLQAAWTTRLSVPLGGRRLVDAADGHEIPLFLAADLLHPTVLPPGYHHAYDTPLYTVGPDGTSPPAPWDATATQLFVGTDGTRLRLLQQYGHHRPPDGTPSGPLVAAHGHLARVIRNGLTWFEGRSGGGGEPPMTVVLLADPGLSTAQLLAIADGLSR